MVLPPQVGETERQVDEPERDEQHHPGDDRAADPAETHRANTPREKPHEDRERRELDDDAHDEETLFAAVVATSARELVCGEEAVLVEPGQMERRDTRPRQQPRSHAPGCGRRS